MELIFHFVFPLFLHHSDGWCVHTGVNDSLKATLKILPRNAIVRNDIPNISS